MAGYRFELTKLRTYDFGTCYKLTPIFEVTEGLFYLELKVILNSHLQGMDKPKSLYLHFTSNLTWIGIIEEVWPQFYPQKEVIDFETEFTRFEAKVVEKRFAEGITDGQRCLKELIVKKSCYPSSPCHLLTYVPYNLRTCETVEEYQCANDGWFHENYTDCFKTKVATTYSMKRSETPFHAPVNDSFTTFDVALRFGAKEIQQEIALLTMADLIGSVGGGLGMFFGFSISATLFYFIDKLINRN